MKNNPSNFEFENEISILPEGVYPVHEPTLFPFRHSMTSWNIGLPSPSDLPNILPSEILTQRPPSYMRRGTGKTSLRLSYELEIIKHAEERQREVNKLFEKNSFDWSKYSVSHQIRPNGRRFFI